LSQTQCYAAGSRDLAHDRETGGATIDRFDRQPVFDERQRVPADTAAEIQRRVPSAPAMGP